MPTERKEPTKKPKKRPKKDLRPITPMTLELCYIFDENNVPFLSWLNNGRGRLSNGLFRCNNENFLGLQIFLLSTWLRKLDSPQEHPKISDPSIFIRPFARSIQYPYPLQWRDLIFGEDPFKRYVRPSGRIFLSVAPTAFLRVKIKLGEHKEAKKEDKESVAKILKHLMQEKSPKDLNITVYAQDPSDPDSEWEIDGKTGEHGLIQNCLVQIRATYINNSPPIIFWLSKSGISELYPNMDPKISSAPPPNPKETRKKLTLTIGSPGIPLETPSGIDACLAVSIPKGQSPGIGHIRKCLDEFLKSNPIWGYQADTRPTKRFFNGLADYDFSNQRGLGAMPEGKDWKDYLLAEVIPTGASAVLLTMPVERHSH